MDSGISGRLREARAALLVSYVAQGALFALLVTRIPGIQKQYGISDGLLPVFLAAVPILAGVGSLSMEWVVKKTSPRAVLRVVQPLVGLTLLGIGAGDRLWQAALALAAFGLAVGGLDASQAMSAVALQHRYGRSIMQSFYAAYSIGGILGASLAWAQVHFHLSLLTMFGATGLAVAAVVLVAGVWYAGPAELGRAVAEAAQAAPARIPWKPLLPLCLAMCVAYIGDATVSNWSAKYLQDGLHSSEQMTTVPYNAYMAVMLLGRLLGDSRVQHWGSARTVRVGAVVCATGFALTALAPTPWVAVVAFAVVGLGISVIVPQVFAAGGRLFPQQSDAAVARLNIFNYVGFLVGSPLVGGLAGGMGYRAAMAVPMVLVLGILLVAPSFGAEAVPAAEPDTVSA
ncbi:MFS transporter [Streptacidiphilus monticola]|uniref:MFS transporter n=1 Tax=Streptacidiphilus monticola TaxID=2161674 RepID=A0ABW1FY66_9ACTN